MLPYSLKVVWFALSLAGLLGSWTALPRFTTHLFVSPWVPLFYGVADTILQGIFCLGLIWKMDPSRMPRAFCIAQTALIHIAWACLSGLCASISLSTAAVVFTSYPGFFRTVTRLPAIIALVIVFPTIVLVLQLAFLLKLDAAQPVDGMNCDASHPTWVRVLGYSGLTLLLSVPSFVLSLMTAMRLFFRSQHPAQKSRPPSQTVFAHDAFTPLPSRRQHTRDSKINSQHDSLQFTSQDTIPQYITPSPLLLPKTLQPESPNRVPTIAKHSKYHLPFDTAQSPSVPSSRKPSTDSRAPTLMRESPVLEPTCRPGLSKKSPSPIIFATPSRNGSQNNTVVVNISPSPVVDAGTDDEKESNSVIQVQPGELEIGEDAVSGSLHWARDSDRGSIRKNEFVYDQTEEEDDAGTYAFPPYPTIRRFGSGQPPWLEEPLDPEPSLLRTVILQLFTSSTLILATISSLVDIFSNRHPPSPLGTQHVALLLAAWGPCLFIVVILCQKSCTYLRS